MKTIKFRAWDSNKKKMYEWHQLVAMDIKGHLTLSNLLNGFVKHIKPLEFIGLKDKNRKEIYESDILIDNVGRVWEVRYNEIGAVFTFHFRGGDTWQTFLRFNIAQKPLEIIGNIHQDKHLIS